MSTGSAEKMGNKTKRTVFGLSPNLNPLTFTNLYKPYRRQLLVGFLLLVATNIFMLSLPRLVNGGVTLVEKGGDHEINLFDVIGLMPKNVAQLSIIIICIAVIGGIVRTLSRTVIFNVGRDIEKDVRRILFSHISTLSASFFRKKNVGDLMSHLTNDTANVRLSLGFAVLNLLNICVVFIGTLPILFSINPLVAGFGLLPFPLVMISAQILSKKMFIRTKEYQKALSNLTSHVQENLSGAHIVRAFHQEKQEEEKFEISNSQMFRAAMRLARIRVTMFPLMRMMGGGWASRQLCFSAVEQFLVVLLL